MGRRSTAGLVGVVVGVAIVLIGSEAFAAGSATSVLAAPAELAETAMTAWKAAILGVVEGLTEYLPISSTGHLLVASELLGLGTTEAELKAVNTYAIAIQFGAILAVAGLFWKRFREMVFGLFGRSEEGRHLLTIVIVGFLPAAVLGFLLDDKIESVLFAAWPIIAAWALGGLLILVLERTGKITRHGIEDEGSEEEAPGEDRDGGHAVGDRASVAAAPLVRRDPLMSITVKQALLIGLIQCLAMWPGTSRSLATILGALLVGVTLGAAVEFSFLLGFVTLSAASGYAVLKDGGNLVEQFGVMNPLIGVLFAFVSAVVAIKWMISYLQRNSLAIFGWYRLLAAGLAAGLVISGALKI